MKSYLSSRVKQLKPSGIRKFFDLANTMEGVISLGVGEPDFITPWSIRQASIQLINQGSISYSEMEGHIELRNLISTYLNSSFQVSYSPKEEIHRA